MKWTTFLEKSTSLIDYDIYIVFLEMSYEVLLILNGEVNHYYKDLYIQK